MSCYQSVKDKNFESNSQHNQIIVRLNLAVISLSKIKISKAIHNVCLLKRLKFLAVISLSKIKISKAIHNASVAASTFAPAVISLSKIKISKAIHNAGITHHKAIRAVISLSKIKISKAIHNDLKLNSTISMLLSVCQR